MIFAGLALARLSAGPSEALAGSWSGAPDPRRVASDEAVKRKMLPTRKSEEPLLEGPISSAPAPAQQSRREELEREVWLDK